MLESGPSHKLSKGKQNTTSAHQNIGEREARKTQVPPLNMQAATSLDLNGRPNLSKEERESLESASDSDVQESSDESSGSDEESSSDEEYGSEEYDSSADSDEKFEDDEEEADQDTADGEALGIDLTRFMKTTAFMHYKQLIKERIDGLVKVIDD